jgi:hypothetical protein
MLRTVSGRPSLSFTQSVAAAVPAILATRYRRRKRFILHPVLWRVLQVYQSAASKFIFCNARHLATFGLLGRFHLPERKWHRM